MKRLWVVLVLALFLAGTSISGVFIVDAKKDEMTACIHSAQEAANKGDRVAAAKFSKKAEEIWIEAEKVLSIFINHSDLAEIGLSVSRLYPLIESGDLAQFKAECQVAKVQLIHIQNDEFEPSSIL